jgi:predicted nucleic acid-binding protein
MPNNDAQMIRDFMDRCALIRLTDSIAERTIDLRQNVKIKLPDALIASTALEYDLTLITRNTADFGRVPGLAIINPYEV